jgi:glutamine synthetase
MAWMKSKAYLSFGDLIDPSTNLPYAYSPRTILKNQINRLKEIGKN